MYLFYVSYFCVFNMSIFLSCKTNLCSWSELTGCFPTSHNIHVFKLICIKKKSMSQVVQLGIILWLFFFIYGGYHNICEFQHFCSKYFLYPFHILDTQENRKKKQCLFCSTSRLGILILWGHFHCILPEYWCWPCHSHYDHSDGCFQLDNALFHKA